MNRQIVGMALASLGIGFVATLLIVSETRASAASKPQGPNWVKLPPLPQSGPSGMPLSALIPPNTRFAISDVSSDPNVGGLISQLNLLATGGAIVSPAGYPGGTQAPADFPPDGLGTNAYRATGTSGSSVLMIPVTQTTTIWIVPTLAPSYLALITDPASVSLYQYAVATAIANGRGALIVGPNAPLPTYGQQDVDGNPKNPKWVAVVSAFQQYADSQGPMQNTGLPGFPTSLRTDGALDYATALTMINA